MRLMLTLGVVLSLITLPSPRSSAAPPRIDPRAYAATVDHPWFPLVPGTVYRYVERSGRDTSDDVVEVLRGTKVILGVRCVVVSDRLTHHGVVREETLDWYAQDRAGTVWYFGESTRERGPDGRVSTRGSWEAGVRGAEPGIVMPARPVAGPPYRQEYLAGEAEDMGQVEAVGDSVRVPAGMFRGCVRTREWSPLESGRERKWYARGVGFVRGASSAGEVCELVSVSRR